MEKDNIVPFQQKSTSQPSVVEGKVIINYNLRTQALNVKAVNIPNELVIFALESAKHVLMHSLKMVPGELPIQAAPVEEEPK